MLARCARCQGTFTTDRFGRQFCPHCGSELILPDPNAPQAPSGAGTGSPPPASGGGQGAAPPEGGGPSWGQPPPSSGVGGISPPPPPGGGWSPLPPSSPPPPPPDGLPAPFADRGGRGFFRAFLDTWKLTALEPQKLFANVRVQVWPAVLFGLLAAWAGTALGRLLSLGIPTSTLGVERWLSKLPPDQADRFRELLEKSAHTSLLELVIGSIVLTPILVLVVMFLVTAVVHLVLMIFRGAARGFEATLVVVGYSFGLWLLFVVPGCGWLIALVWQAVVMIIGLAAIHRTSTGKGAAAVLLPLILCCCCVCVLLWFGIMALAAALGGAGGGTSNL